MLAAVGIWASSLVLPSKWDQEGATVLRIHAVVATWAGLVSGLLIGLSTNYYTSYEYWPVQEMAQSCSTGAAVNIIYGLALGYLSTIIPVLLLAATIVGSMSLLGVLGPALAALGMLSTLAIGLAVDAFGPVCDNAGGIAEMSELG